jgi:hypothetical protein
MPAEPGRSTGAAVGTPGAALGSYPDFFVVGHHKSGTSALYEMLRRHPAVFMPDLKEPRFMASDMRSRFRYAREQPHPQTEEEYLALFAPALPGQTVGEASATYLWSHTAAERIAQEVPSARIVAILREPASFLHSLHLTFVRGHVEDETDLRKALALEDERRQGRHIPKRSHLPQLLIYSEHVRYVEQLKRYAARFPREQILVLIYDDFRADNAATMRRVFEHLGVDPSVEVETGQVNVTRRTVRSHRSHDAVDAITLGTGTVASSARRLIKAVTPQALRHRAFLSARRRIVTAEAPQADPELALELHRRFKPEVVAISEYLDRDLVTLWGYDDLG